MRRLIVLGLTLAALAGCAGAPQRGEEQGMVDRATLSVQELLGEGNDRVDAVSLLRRARAVVVCPRVFRGGFFFGAEGGECLLAARDGSGSWSSPAFYSLTSLSFGLQAGVQDLQVMMLVMNDRALSAMLDSQFKFGGDASLALATLGGAVGGSTTAAAGADIVLVARSRGLYAGLTLEGSFLNPRSEWNRSYYGRETGARDIVLAMTSHNPGADPLRAVLGRYGGAAPAGAAGFPPPAAATEPPAPPPPRGAPSGRVQRQALPPVR